MGWSRRVAVTLEIESGEKLDTLRKASFWAGVLTAGSQNFNDVVQVQANVIQSEKAPKPKKK